MLPSNTALSRNIQFLLGRYRHQKTAQQQIKQPVFMRPSLEKKRQSWKSEALDKEDQTLLQKQKFIKERIRLIHNYSIKKIKAIEKRKRASIDSITQKDCHLNSHNASIDSTIQLPWKNQSSKHSQQREDSIDSLIEQKLLRRKGTTQYIFKNRSKKQKQISFENKTIETKQHCMFDYRCEDQHKKSQSRRKSWIVSRFPSFAKSSREQFPMVNTNTNNHHEIENQKIVQIVLSQQSDILNRPALLPTNNQSKNQKQNIMTPVIIPASLNKFPNKDARNSKRPKHIILNRVFKSKTESLKIIDDKICPWDRLPDLALQQDSTILEHLNQ